MAIGVKNFQATGKIPPQSWRCKVSDFEDKKKKNLIFTSFREKVAAGGPPWIMQLSEGYEMKQSRVKVATPAYTSDCLCCCCCCCSRDRPAVRAREITEDSDLFARSSGDDRARGTLAEYLRRLEVFWFAYVVKMKLTWIEIQREEVALVIL